MIRNQLYPYIEKYINDYLHGFTKEQLTLAITQGELKLEKINIRPDAINKTMDENNVPFWLKAGLISKIHIGCSVMNIIGEIPLEILIDKIDIILSPSYKWILKNMDSKKLSDIIENVINPIYSEKKNENDLENFDVSVFIKPIIDEIFKDKTDFSKSINSMFDGIYKYFEMPNFAVIAKIENIHIRIEDDQLTNYFADIALGFKIEKIFLQLGFKGSMKKNVFKISKFDMYWETNAKILIPILFYNSCMINGELSKKYYNELEEQKIQNFEYSQGTKLIVENFSININFGTKNNNEKNNDIFDIKNENYKMYVQIASNELVLNLYPELLLIQKNLLTFMSSFNIIEKLQQYKPNQSIINITNNYNKKIAIRNWVNFIFWSQKLLKNQIILKDNPFREEFKRFYNIYILKKNIFDILNKENNNDEDKKNNANEEETQRGGNNEINKNKIPMDEKNINANLTITNSNKNNLNKNKDNSKNKIKEEDKQIRDFTVSFIFKFLIKGIIINLHPGVKSDCVNLAIFNINSLNIKIELNKEQFNFLMGADSFDIYTNKTIYGERVILCPNSYRKDLPINQISKKNFLNDSINNKFTNYLKNTEDLGLSRLIKKFNPNHEEKVKIIDESLNIGASLTYFKSNNNDLINSVPLNNLTMTKIKSNEKLRASNQNSNSSMTQNKFNTPFNLNNSINLTHYSQIRNTSNFSNIGISRRPSSFAKTVINNYEKKNLRKKQELKKQKNELDISQAINSYNTKIIKLRKINPLNLKSSNNKISKTSYNFLKNNKNQIINNKKNIILKNKNPQINSDNFLTNISFNEKQSPLNFIEIYSNNDVGAFKINFIKYNNKVSLDEFSIQLGTIRSNFFSKYISELLSVLIDYKIVTNTPEIIRNPIKSSDGGGIDGTKNLMKMREYFYSLLTRLPPDQKTESIKEYINYLKNEIKKYKNLHFNSDEYFQLNYLFSIFPKGVKIHFDYENIECVYYNNLNKLLGKIMIEPYEINFTINLSKINVKLFGLSLEVNDLEESKSLMEQIKKILDEKLKITKIILEPCYKLLKEELEKSK